MEHRNIAIDIVKFIAVLFVMNSHMDICYPRYNFLATGGAIGDALFFFSSGFTLFLGRKLRFDNWYKRRINRIYPSVIATSIFVYIIWGLSENIGDILLCKRYWFIGCILIYYIILFPIKEYKNGAYAMHSLIIGGICCIAMYFCFFNDGQTFYGGGLFRCLAYFLIMLQGAIMGRNQNKYDYKHRYILLLILCIGLWYFLCYVGSDNWMIILSLLPLFGITRYFYLVSNAPIFRKLYFQKFAGNFIYIISQLCLEVYLIQKFVFTDTLNNLFPLNIPIIMIMVILTAYIIKIMSNIISQTFDSTPYEWNKIILYKR